MKVILHIGMGKTGTSSIQQTLAKNVDFLRSQNLEYLGMWFDMVDPNFKNYDGQQKFFDSSEIEMSLYANKFIEALRRAEASTGIDRYLISNETIYAKLTSFTPFISALKSMADVQIIVYLRDPRDWLPSAYNQWSIYHKGQAGPIPSYRTRSRQLISSYSGVQQWHKIFGDILTVRVFEKSKDVIDDFSSILNVQLEKLEKRRLERVEISESVLRAYYNNRFLEDKLPFAFNDAFKDIDFAHSFQLNELIQRSFDYTITDEIIAERHAPLDFIKSTFGIDLLSGPPPTHRSVDVETLRNRIIDHLLNIVMHQADQIKTLEEKVARLQANEN